MAAGDITYDTDPIKSGGSYFVVTGQIEADGTARAFQLVHTSHTLLWCNLPDLNGVNIGQPTLNSNNGTEDSDNGSIYLSANPGGDITLKFVAAYR